MAARKATVDRSTLRLSEVARHVVIPDGIERSLWLGWDGQPGVEARCREFGVRFDAWQDGLSQVALGVRATGLFAATVGGIVFSIPRQVAKTFITMVLVVALCTMFPNLTVLWTAHRTRTATQTFQKMQGFVKRKAVKRYLAPSRTDGIRATNGEQEIAFRNGSRIMFGAREQGFGRGFDEVDIEVFDEAQILTEKALEDMVAATNQSRWAFGALLFFMGTPPRPVDPGEEFTQRRNDALGAKRHAGVDDFAGVVESGDMVYIECSGDANVGMPGGADLDDRRQVEKANPSYPHRTPDVSIQRLRKNLKSNGSWRREGLGVWDENETMTREITADEWAATATTEAPSDGIRTLAVAFSQDGSRQSTAGAVKHDGGVHVEIVGAHTGPRDAGVRSLVRWLTEDREHPERWRTFAQITMSGRAGATSLHQALRDAGVPAKVLHVASTPDYLASCSAFLDAVRDQAVTHPKGGEGDVLDASVAVTAKKARGMDGAFGWDSSIPDGDETPLEAAGLAYRAAVTTKRRPGRKQVLL